MRKLLLSLISVLCLISVNYSNTFADSSLDLIKVTHSKSLEYFCIESVWVHTVLEPSENKLKKDGFYNSAASGRCRLGDKMLVWDYQPRYLSNPMGHCGASNYGGVLNVKVDGKVFMKDIHMGGDTSCYGSPIKKIVINTYEGEVEAFIYSKSTDDSYSASVDFYGSPVTFEDLQKLIGL